jgi:hypothetical protein
VIGVQACAGSGFSAHYRKITEEKAEETIAWLTTAVKCPCGCDQEVKATRLELWGWRKVKLQRGRKAMRWVPRVKVITLADVLGEQNQVAMPLSAMGG